MLVPLVALGCGALGCGALGCGRLDYLPQSGTDAGRTDAGIEDAGTADTGTADAGGMDAGTADAGIEDAGTADGGGMDAGLDDDGVDGGALDAGLDASTSDGGPLGTFVPPTPLAGLGSTTGADEPSLTADRLELYLNVSSDLFVSRRASTAGAWSAPAAVTELNTARVESSPEVSPDGLLLYFSRDEGSGTSVDLWRSSRASRSDPWGTPAKIAELSTATFETNGAATGDGTRIVFARGSSPSARDLFEATRASSSVPFGAPTPIVELSTGANEGGPMLALGGTSIVFFSDRPGSTGNDLYLATRPTPSSPFGPALRLTELATLGDESDPWMSEDGHHLVFARDGILVETTR